MSKTDMKNNVFGKSKDECPDEEMLGLFVEHSLDESEMASTASHVIGCDRCKEIVKEHVKWLLAGKRLAILHFRTGDLPKWGIPYRRSEPAADGFVR